MSTSAMYAMTERTSSPMLTLGDLVAAASEVAEGRAAELLTTLFTSGQVRFVDPDALDRLATVSSPLCSARPASKGKDARARGKCSRSVARDN